MEKGAAQAPFWLFCAFHSREIVISCNPIKYGKFLWYNSVGAFALAEMVFCRSNRKTNYLKSYIKSKRCFGNLGKS